MVNGIVGLSCSPLLSPAYSWYESQKQRQHGKVAGQSAEQTTFEMEFRHGLTRQPASILVGVIQSGLTPFNGNLQFLADLRNTVPVIISVVAT